MLKSQPNKPLQCTLDINICALLYHSNQFEDGYEQVNICMISGLAKYSGGVENVVHELSTYLSSNGVNVTIYGRNNQDFTETKDNLETVSVRPYNLMPKRFRIAFYDKMAFSLKASRKIKEANRWDIVHGHGDNCFFYPYLRSEKPFLMTFHGTWAKSQKRLLPQMMTMYYAEKNAAKKCDLAIACSNAVKNELIDFYGVNKNKIVVIHNGVEVNKFVPQDKASARKQLKLPLDKKYVLWVGASPERKGLNTAMKALKTLPNVTLLVAGFRGENVGNTHFLGRVSEGDLIAAYSAADLLVFPTVYEGFPVVPMEALSCGLPVVVSQESNLNEIITEGVHGHVIQQGTPEKYRDKIGLLLKDDLKLQQMSIECRKLALKYSWAVQAKKYLSLYQKVVS